MHFKWYVHASYTIIFVLHFLKEFFFYQKTILIIFLFGIRSWCCCRWWFVVNNNYLQFSVIISKLFASEKIWKKKYISRMFAFRDGQNPNDVNILSINRRTNKGMSIKFIVCLKCTKFFLRKKQWISLLCFFLARIACVCAAKRFYARSN